MVVVYYFMDVKYSTLDLSDQNQPWIDMIKIVWFQIIYPP